MPVDVPIDGHIFTFDEQPTPEKVQQVRQKLAAKAPPPAAAPPSAEPGFGTDLASMGLQAGVGGALTASGVGAPIAVPAAMAAGALPYAIQRGGLPSLWEGVGVAAGEVPFGKLAKHLPPGIRQPIERVGQRAVEMGGEALGKIMSPLRKPAQQALEASGLIRGTAAQTVGSIYRQPTAMAGDLLNRMKGMLRAGTEKRLTESTVSDVGRRFSGTTASDVGRTFTGSETGKVGKELTSTATADVAKTAAGRETSDVTRIPMEMEQEGATRSLTETHRGAQSELGTETQRTGTSQLGTESQKAGTSQVGTEGQRSGTGRAMVESQKTVTSRIEPMMKDALHETLQTFGFDVSKMSEKEFLTLVRESPERAAAAIQAFETASGQRLIEPGQLQHLWVSDLMQGAGRRVREGARGARGLVVDPGGAYVLDGKLVSDAWKALTPEGRMTFGPAAAQAFDGLVTALEKLPKAGRGVRQLAQKGSISMTGPFAAIMDYVRKVPSAGKLAGGIGIGTTAAELLPHIPGGKVAGAVAGIELTRRGARALTDRLLSTPEGIRWLTSGVDQIGRGLPSVMVAQGMSRMLMRSPQLLASLGLPNPNPQPLPGQQAGFQLPGMPPGMGIPGRP